MPRARHAAPAEPLAFPGAGTQIAMVSVHTSPLARPGGYAAGGMNVYIRETARYLGSHGYSVDVFTRDDGSGPEISTPVAGVRVIALRAGPRQPLQKEEIAELLPEYLHALRTFRQQHDLRYDLLHSHYWQGGWVASLLAPRWGIPHIAMFHTLGEAKNRAHLQEHESAQRIACERRIAATADRIICVGEDERRQLSRLYGAPAERMTVIPCGVDLRRFRPGDRAAARRALGLDASPLVLFVGRLEPLKGIDILIEAMAQLECREAKLLVVGGDAQSAAELARLQDRTQALGLSGRVTFLGAVEQSELPRYYNAADVCVMPSYTESFGLVAVEAMACGTPVIASRVGGLAATVSDGETGYLIPWRCPEPFAERIDLVLGNADLRANLGRAARRSMHRFSWERITSQLAAEYRRVWSEYTEGAACHGDDTRLHAVGSAHLTCDPR